MTAPAAAASAAARISGATPVHSTTMSGRSASADSRSLWYVAPSASTSAGFGPLVTWSSTWTLPSRPYCAPISAASSPIGPGTDDQHLTRLPERPSADRRDVLPRLRENRRRLEQDPKDAQALVDLHRILGFDSPAIGHEPVHLLDASLGVTAVGAHVPFPHRAVRTGHGIGSPHDPDDVVADGETTRSWVDHPAERLVSEDQTLTAGRRPPV